MSAAAGLDIVCVGLAPWAKDPVLRALPECVEIEGGVNEATLQAMCRGGRSMIVILDEDALEQSENDRGGVALALGCFEALVICREERPEVHEAAVRWGCSGVLGVTAETEVYRRAVEALRAGELWFPRAVLSKLAKGSQMSEPWQRLTVREREILELVAAGQKNQAIADRLFISRETVRWHHRTLYSKLGISGRVAAQAFARRRSPDGISGQSESGLSRG